MRIALYNRAIAVRVVPIDFTIPDHTGAAFSISAALHASPLLIVFIRGHWCPYCRRYLCKLQANLNRIESAGARVVVISPEPPHTSATLVRELRLHFPILSDAEGRVIDFFGVRNRFTAAATLLPHAAVIIVDRQQAIRFRSIDRNYKQRTTIRTILRAIASLHGAAAEPTSA